MTRNALGLSILFTLVVLAPLAADDEKVFSGPQKGEKLTGFKTIGVYDKLAGKEIDPIKEAGGKPMAVIFVHKLTRPSASVMRAVAGYGDAQAKKGLQTYLVWLTEDRTMTEAYLKRARGSLKFTVPVVISKDGIEGPGAYGLNRKMTLTILVAKDNKVTANFALIQPSLQADAPKVVEAMAKTIGEKAPTAEELAKIAFPGQARVDQMKGILRGLINKMVTEEDVKKSAEAIEKIIKGNRGAQRELGRVSAIAVKQKYGTEAAQKHLQSWAKKYGPKQN